MDLLENMLLTNPEEYQQLVNFTTATTWKMKDKLPWNQHCDYEMSDWIQIGMIGLHKFYSRSVIPGKSTPDYWKLLTTYINTELRNEIQKLTTKARHLNNLIDSEVDFERSKIYSSPLHGEVNRPDTELRSKTTSDSVLAIAARLGGKYPDLAYLLIMRGNSKSDFLDLCKNLKVGTSKLTEMMKTLEEECRREIDVSSDGDQCPTINPAVYRFEEDIQKYKEDDDKEKVVTIVLDAAESYKIVSKCEKTQAESIKEYRREKRLEFLSKCSPITIRKWDVDGTETVITKASTDRRERKEVHI